MLNTHIFGLVVFIKIYFKNKIYSKDLMAYKSLFSQCKMVFSIFHLSRISAYPVFSWMLEVCHQLSGEEEVSADFH